MLVSPAVKIKKTLKNQTVTETQEAVFTLELTHSDVKGSQWIKNGVELNNSDKYEISRDGMVHTLRVKHCNTQDESVYSFKLGKLSASARLNVESQYHLSVCKIAVRFRHVAKIQTLLPAACFISSYQNHQEDKGCDVTDGQHRLLRDEHVT